MLILSLKTPAGLYDDELGIVKGVSTSEIKVLTKNLRKLRSTEIKC